MRCFVAIPLSPDVRQALFEAGTAVRSADARWRGEKWVAETNLHITVAFLGDVEPGELQAVTEQLGRVLERWKRFELPFSALRPKPNGRRTTMLWAVYEDPDGRAAELAADVGRACAHCGIALEERPFTAHVTLVRTRKPHPAGQAALDALTAAETTVPPFVSVGEVTLLSSTLTKAGPVYDPIATWEFSA